VCQIYLSPAPTPMSKDFFHPQFDLEETSHLSPTPLSPPPPLALSVYQWAVTVSLFLLYLTSSFSLLISASLILSLPLSALLLIIFYLSLSLSLSFSFSLCVLPLFVPPIISVLILLSPCLEIRCAGKFSLYTIQMSVLF
jgi:hypothetical protein